MQIWIVHALLALGGFTGIYLCLKWLTIYNLSSTLINTYFFILTGIGFVFLNLFQKGSFVPPAKTWPIFLVLTCIAVFGNYFSVKAFETAPNPAYVTAIVSTSVVLLALISVIAFGSQLTLIKAFGILLAVSGVIILALF